MRHISPRYHDVAAATLLWSNGSRRRPLRVKLQKLTPYISRMIDITTIAQRIEAVRSNAMTLPGREAVTVVEVMTALWRQVRNDRRPIPWAPRRRLRRRIARSRRPG